MPVDGLSERRSIRSSLGTWRVGLPSTTSAADRSGGMGLKQASPDDLPMIDIHHR
jgi:hypothetical protein